MGKRAVKSLIFVLLAICFAPHLPLNAQEAGKRGLYVTMLAEPPALSSREEIHRLIRLANESRIGTLFVQIYRANKSYFPSKIADSSPYEHALAGTGEDPLALLIRDAHAANIKVHAWLNVLSLSANQEAPILKKYGTSILTTNLKPKQNAEDYKIDSQYFLEPGDLRLHDEFLELVREILQRYPQLDGIQFDYIRYPDVHPSYGYTAKNMERYLASSVQGKIVEGSSEWNDWKRKQVTELLSALVKEARAMRPGIEVSATGCMPYVRAYHEAFQDWFSWVNSGLVDFAVMMSYTQDPATFGKYVEDIQNRISDFGKVKIAVGAYKLTASPDLFSTQMRLCEQSGSSGCVILHDGSLRDSHDLAEKLQ